MVAARQCQLHARSERQPPSELCQWRQVTVGGPSRSTREPSGSGPGVSPAYALDLDDDGDAPCLLVCIAIVGWAAACVLRVGQTFRLHGVEEGEDDRLTVNLTRGFHTLMAGEISTW